MKDKFQSFKMGSTKRILPPAGTDRNINSLEHFPENLKLTIDF